MVLEDHGLLVGLRVLSLRLRNARRSPKLLLKRMPMKIYKIKTIAYICDVSLIDDIMVDIEILQSKTDALQSLTNVPEGCSSIIDNTS